ncbi:MAG: family 16 glycosylhydrolase [Gammaproteobacteria bacterium]|nr:family 16 glycosylhydrolase [Gammaproteobacteria bacterium]
MNLSKPLRAASRFIYTLLLQCRTHLPRQQCLAFVPPSVTHQSGIGPIFVINLDRQPDRWANMLRELACILDATGKPLSVRAIRYSACDGQADVQQLFDGSDVEPFYTLGDQLFVEPQPLAVPDEFDLMRPIRMSRAEVAVARSHIGVWKTIAQSSAPYALILEDDVCVERGFGRLVDQAWQEMRDADRTSPAFDVLYVSYKEARYGAPKELVSKNVFRPERGIWYLSGYVLSKRGAQALLDLLPCHGPVDLWINHKFRDLDVRALRRSVINQRLDTPSTNSYSILPALSRIGVLDGSDASLFHQRPTHSPVFAFGTPGSGVSSLAMALSMLGYRCCSDLDRIPEIEFESLIAGRTSCIFNAYVNIASLRPHVHTLMQRYPGAKFIMIDNEAGAVDHYSDGILNALEGADLVRLYGEDANTWRALCEHVRLSPPAALYPTVLNIGQRRLRHAEVNTPATRPVKRLRHDRSPWVIPHAEWAGISVSVTEVLGPSASRVSFEDDLADVQSERWLLRNDTFPGNLGLFRPANVTSQSGGGLSFAVSQQPLGVRNLSAAAISSRGSFLYGRFEATLQATSVSGLVTGFFLHRDSPRQEIDIEITGNRPDRLLVNVFYNPGAEGAKFDYGYRGTPVAIPLDFDASKAPHQFAIEWDPCEIRWFVDGELVHRRAAWNPTPIPHLPMTLHVNTWPTRSRELAGRLLLRSLPASAIVRRIVVDASSYEAQPLMPVCRGASNASIGEVSAEPCN